MTKIMLVEDDKSLREIYSIRLVAEGYDIVSAGDGEEALALAVQEKPELIVSDVMMPKISGFDMLDILRSTPETSNIKVIMMTALSSDDQRMRGENLGADRYLVKSQVGIEDVINTVHEVLGDKPTANAATNLDVAASTAPAAPAAPASAEPVTPAPAAPATPAPAAPIPAAPAPAAPAPAAPIPASVAPSPAPVAPTPVAAAPTPVAPAPAPIPATPATPAPAAPVTPQPIIPQAPNPAAPAAPAATPQPVIPQTPQAPTANFNPAPAAQPAAVPTPIAPQAAGAPAPAPAPVAASPQEEQRGGERVIEPLHDTNSEEEREEMSRKMDELLGNVPTEQSRPTQTEEEDDFADEEPDPDSIQPGYAQNLATALNRDLNEGGEPDPNSNAAKMSEDLKNDPLTQQAQAMAPEAAEPVEQAAPAEPIAPAEAENNA